MAMQFILVLTVLKNKHFVICNDAQIPYHYDQEAPRNMQGNPVHGNFIIVIIFNQLIVKGLFTLV